MLEQFSLNGKTALVTGGNGGLGLMIALGLKEAGARVIGAGRNPAKNAAAAGQLDGCVSLDVTNEADVDSLFESLGPIDILVNAAGFAVVGQSTKVEASAFRGVLDVHVTGSFLCARAAARRMPKGGKIINIGSMYSQFGSPVAGSYAAAKAGILGLTRSLAVELASCNIQVNALLPGWFETDSTRPLFATPLGGRILELTPAGRYGQGREVAAAAVFLASDAASFITGAALPVDGGYSITGGLTANDWAPFL
ncbi:MAG TPA: SDR family oxidoreductase [Bryobacteraceae bacterium]|nr:SDR family oxidoreductase [Bryobacteraceae bacterium]HPT28584.1 SDR family oxidoreductase [Bryobacteraceae bacterium]